jgi:uncharacterized short protein YbdD (DUF466 family)
VTTVRQALRWVRRLCDDDAYERYLAHHAATHPEQPVLDRRSFYLESQRRKWSGVTRCC